MHSLLSDSAQKIVPIFEAPPVSAQLLSHIDWSNSSRANTPNLSFPAFPCLFSRAVCCGRRGGAGAGPRGRPASPRVRGARRPPSRACARTHGANGPWHGPAQTPPHAARDVSRGGTTGAPRLVWDAMPRAQRPGRCGADGRAKCGGVLRARGTLPAACRAPHSSLRAGPPAQRAIMRCCRRDSAAAAARRLTCTSPTPPLRQYLQGKLATGTWRAYPATLAGTLVLAPA